jgi:hypothetical protein
MIFLYTSLLFLLGTTHFLLRRRVTSLERKYARVAREADDLVRQPGYRDSNGGRGDPYLTAKRQYQLGLLAQRRDRLEARYVAWQGRAEKFGALVARIRSWKGRKLPYTLGVLDVLFVLSVIDYLGAGQYLNARSLLQAVTSLWAR